MRYLVTGGCGFIGSNLVRRLRPLGADIRVLDNLTMGRAEDLEGLGVELQVGDIRDAAAVAAAVRDVDVVVHLAAHTRVLDSIRQPEENFDINVRGTLTVLQASVAAGVRRVVLASTGGAILGDRTPPVHEEMAPRPLSPYGAGKLAAEGYCSAFWGSYGLRTVALRFSNVYGPYSYAKASAVAKFMKQILRGETLTVFGNGSQTRDFLFVEDLCDAVIAASTLEIPWGRPYQIASGIETPLLALIDEIRAVVRPALVETVFAPAQQGEVYRNYAAIDEARRHLAFDPTTRLPEGLSRTWTWFQGVPASRLTIG